MIENENIEGMLAHLNELSNYRYNFVQLYFERLLPQFTLNI
jgi:hypothetical protein